MGDFETIGKVVAGIGAALVVVGGIVWLLGKVPFVGRLPGDIRIERPGFSCFVPVASSILLSIVLTILLNVIGRLLNR
jgi:hypothetical protein